MTKPLPSNVNLLPEEVRKTSNAKKMKRKREKPTKPDKDSLDALAEAESESGFFEAALLHLWIPLEYLCKELISNNSMDGAWPDSLGVQCKPINKLCENDDVKIALYSTATINKQDHSTSKSILTELGLKETVKEYRNKVAHNGARLSKQEYYACKHLISNAFDLCCKWQGEP
jgi:hypothetical protein